MKTIRIFISSPGDVQEERIKARSIIGSLQRRYDDQVRLVPVLWEDLALPSTSSFQQGIEHVLSTRHRIDIAVFIFWTRLGKPLGPTAENWGLPPATTGSEREFDLMTSAFQQSGGAFPFILTYLRSDHEEYVKKFSEEALQGRGAELVYYKEKLDGFIKARFKDVQGHYLGAYQRYTDLVNFAEKLDDHLDQVVQDIQGSDIPRVAWPDESPYRSLSVFEIKHSSLFYGREEEILDLLQRLRDQRAPDDQRTLGDQRDPDCAFVCIVGASGAGKSSLARAGVAARLLERSFDDKVKEWRVVIFMPSMTAGDLFGGFAKVLAEVLPEVLPFISLADYANRMEKNIQAATDLLGAALKRAGEELKGALKVLVVLDQMEEFWSIQSITSASRESFFQCIEAFARGGSVSVLGTLRSDFFPFAQASRGFMKLKGERGHFDLTMPGTAALHKLILKPANRAGLKFDYDPETRTSLDQAILEDATSDESSLPLLQYALSELYDCRDKPTQRLTFSAYESIGRVVGALERRLQHVCDSLPREVHNALYEIFPLVVVVDERNSLLVARHAALMSDLTATANRARLTEKLIESRFLTADRDKDGAPIASLAHESLLKKWKQLTEWLEENREFLRIRSRIEQGQRRWKEEKGDPSLLLHTGVPLNDGRRLLLYGSRLVEASAFQPLVEYIRLSLAHSLRAAIEIGKRKLIEYSDDIYRDHPDVWTSVIAESFQSKSPVVRMNVASIFAARPPGEFQEKLLQLVLLDSEESVRHSAARSLVASGDAQAFDRIRSYGLSSDSKSDVSQEVCTALAQIKAVSDMQERRPSFEDWFVKLDPKLAAMTLRRSRWLRFRNSLSVFTFVAIPASAFAVVGASGIKWIPSAFNYSCVQTTASPIVGLFYGAPPGVILGGGTVVGLTLYRMVFGREYDVASLTQPRAALVFGAIFGLLTGIVCVLLIALVYKTESLQQMGWTESSVKATQLRDMFFGNLCGWLFPLTSMGLGIGFALMTNCLRGSKQWPEFLDKQDAISNVGQLWKVIAGITRVTLPFSWPIWSFVPLMAMIGLAITSIVDRSPPRAPMSISEAFLGGFDDPIPREVAHDKAKMAEFEKNQIMRRTVWKSSMAGRSLGLLGDCLSKMVGGYTCIVGMGLGIVLLRHGLKIEPKDIHG